MSGFHDVQFPTDISYGASGGPGFSTSVIASVSGFERRNVNWSKARGRWNVAHGLKRREQIAALIAFFRARYGRAYGFRFKDWSDFQATSSFIGTGDSTTKTFNLQKIYSSGAESFTRKITRPVQDTLKIYRDGVEASTGWSVDDATGLVTFTSAPAVDVAVTADFEFDVPARFDTDQMDISIETYDLARWSEIPIVEIRE
jgi:uncharacterized protein (TIGR02217 family)